MKLLSFTGYFLDFFLDPEDGRSMFHRDFGERFVS
jgi:hypothetical protein